MTYTSIINSQFLYNAKLYPILQKLNTTQLFILILKLTNLLSNFVILIMKHNFLIERSIIMSDYYEQSQDSTVKRDNEDDARLMSMLIFLLGFFTSVIGPLLFGLSSAMNHD